MTAKLLKLKSKFSEYLPLLIIITICAFILFLRSGRDLLNDWDECIYAQYAKEMKLTSNYLINQWNGNLVFEKPPLNSVFLQIPYLLGINEFTSRFIFIFWTLLLLVCVYIFAKKYFNNLVAIASCLLILTLNIVVGYGTKVNTDIGFTLFIFFGVFSWLISFKNKRFSYLSGLFLGLAVLNKGLSITPYIMAIFLTIFLDNSKYRFKRFLELILMFLIIIVPWHLYAYLKYGQQFIQVYFIEHIIKRVNNTLDFHFEGRLFYLKLIFNNFKPWLLFIFTVPLIFIKKHPKINLSSVRQFIKNYQILVILSLLIIIPLISITLVKTRLAWYAMPIFPYLSILLAYIIYLFFKEFKIEKLFYVVIFLLAIEGLNSIVKETRFNKKQREIPRRQDIFIKANNYQGSEINYLVWHAERTARAILPKNMQTSTTFIYGGNPCAVYYSNKKINYYYSIDDFIKNVKQKKGIYIIENSDQNLIKDLPIKILYNNIDYTLFKN